MKSLHVIVIIIKAHLKIVNYNIEEFEDAKGVIKIKGQDRRLATTKDKRTNNDL